METFSQLAPRFEMSTQNQENRNIKEKGTNMTILTIILIYLTIKIIVHDAQLSIIENISIKEYSGREIIDLVYYLQTRIYSFKDSRPMQLLDTCNYWTRATNCMVQLVDTCNYWTHANSRHMQLLDMHQCQRGPTRANTPSTPNPGNLARIRRRFVNRNIASRFYSCARMNMRLFHNFYIIYAVQA